MAVDVPSNLVRWTITDSALVVVALLGGVVVPLIVSATSHALSIPHNDDWSYRSIALELFRHGRLAFNGWGLTALVGEVLSVQPLLHATGGAGWTFGVYGAVSAAVALTATYALARRYLRPFSSFCATCLVAVAPGFTTTATTFMTDMPSIAATTSCLALGRAGLDHSGRRRGLYLGAALVVGLFGFSIRQFCLAAPLAVLAALFLSSPRRWRQWLPATLLVGVSAIAISVGVSAVPGPHQTQTVALSIRNELSASKLLADIGLMLLPATMWILLSRSRRRARALFACAGVAVLGVVLVLRLPLLPLARNLMTPVGALGDDVLAGGRPALFGAATWNLIELSGLLGAVALGAIAVDVLLDGPVRTLVRRLVAWPARREQLLVCYLAIAAVGLALFTGSGTFDRYAWPLVAPCAILLLRRARRGSATLLHRLRVVSVAVAAVGIAAISATLTLNGDAFDAARWHAGTLFATSGIAAARVDAGYEWLGYHHGGSIDGGSHQGSEQFTWYEWLVSTTPICALVAASPIADSSLVAAGTVSYRLWDLFGPQEQLYLYFAPDNRGCQLD